MAATSVTSQWVYRIQPVRVTVLFPAASPTASRSTDISTLCRACFRWGQSRSPTDWSLAPSGLQEGDQFRLLFISSAHRSASPSEIATYNTWIQARAANGHTDIQDYSSSFRAVGSTEDMDARDNTYTTYTSSDKGVAIYWLGGNKVADDYEDFYDEDWDEEASMTNESGTAESGVSAWTGSDHDGTEMLQGTLETSRALGNSNNAWVRFGKTDSASHGPLSGATANRTDNKRIYGLSGVFEVVVANSPATGKPAISGTPEVNKTLTADISSIMDADGLPAADQFSYQWVRNDGTDDSDISSARDSTYRLKAADLGKTIKVKVTFTDEGGTDETLTSDGTTAVATDTTAPAFTQGSSNLAGNQVRLSFDEVFDGDPQNWPPLSAFTLTADNSTVAVSGVIPIGNEVLVTGLSPVIRQGQTVKVEYTDPTAGNDTAALQDAAGHDTASFTATLTNNSNVAPVAPGAPTSLTATASGGTQIDLTWTAPADNGGRVVEGYQIEKSDDGGTSWSVLVADTQSTGTMYSDTTLSGGDTRHYRVSAINSIDTGAASTVANATTLSGPGVASVTVDQATITKTGGGRNRDGGQPAKRSPHGVPALPSGGRQLAGGREPEHTDHRGCHHLHPDRADREHGLRRGGVPGQHLRLGSQDRLLHDLAHEAG